MIHSQVCQFVCSRVSGSQDVVCLKRVKTFYDSHRLGVVALQRRTFHFVFARYLSQDQLAIPLHDDVSHAQCQRTLDASDKPAKFCLVVGKSISQELHSAPNFSSCLGIVEDHSRAGDARIAARSAVEAEDVSPVSHDLPVGIPDLLISWVKLGRYQPTTIV